MGNTVIPCVWEGMTIPNPNGMVIPNQKSFQAKEWNGGRK